MGCRFLSVCVNCGKRYSASPNKLRLNTVSEGECDVCGAQAWTSPAYDYDWDNASYQQADACRRSRLSSTERGDTTATADSE